MPAKLSTFVVTLTILVSAGILYHFHSSEPTYKGKTTRQWLMEYDFDHSRLDDSAHEALSTLGTNSVPSLLDLLRCEESYATKWKRRINEMGLPFRFSFTPPEFYYGRVVAAFRVLGPQGEPAIPTLVALLSDPHRRPYAVLSLAAIGQSGSTALNAALQHYDMTVQRAVTQVLASAVKPSAATNGRDDGSKAHK